MTSLLETTPWVAAAIVRVRTGIVFLLLPLLLLLVPTTADARSRRSGPVAVPDSRAAYFGTYSPPSSSWSEQSQKAEYRELEERLGRTLDVAHYYDPWRDRFPTWRERWHVRNGRIPLISWARYDPGAIRSGSEDAVIRARADGLDDFRKPVFLRWFWEMDAGSGASASDYIAAWRRIHDIFQDRGATNVAFVWCPTAWGFASGAAQDYYPGNAYVDWVCADAYNWAPGRPGDEWRSLARAIRPFYEWGRETGKPMMLGEWGVQEREPGDKAEWFRQAGRDLERKFPKVRALVYFDSRATYDWRVDTSASSLRAFRAIASDPYFNP
jgi:hypothetical protein